jgi:outer membrane protein assembly factor BamB
VDDRVAFVIPTTLLQLDRVYGDGKSKLDLRFPAGTGPATDGTRLLLGGLDQRLYAFEARNPLAGWKVMTDGPITATPVVWERYVFFASSAGTVYACRASDKVLRWRSSIYGSITGDLAVNALGVYVPGRDQSLYLLDLAFGQVAWQARFSGPLYEPPVVTPELAFQYCPDDGLVAVNTATMGVDERLRWKLRAGRTLLTVDDQYAYVLTQDQTVVAAGLGSGEVARTLPAAGLTLFAPSPDRMAIFLAGTDGRLICIRPRGTAPVTQKDVLAALNPPAGAEEAPTTAPVATRPSTAEEPDPLRTSRTGVPLGGRSRISRDYGKGGSK